MRRPRRPPARPSVPGVGALACILVLAGCTGADPGAARTPTVATDQPTDRSTSQPSAGAGTGPTPSAVTAIPTVAVTGVSDVVTGLDAPWGVAFLADGRALVTLRDAARVVVLDAPAPGAAATFLTGPGADALAGTTTVRGEGGLLGIAVAPESGPRAGDVYLYRTTADGNEVVRATLDAAPGSAPVLGELEPVLTGIPSSGNHNGGRLAFGPDGFLYVTTGDAGRPERSQDPTSLGGKILRLTVDGAPAPGNPTPGSPVWSLGHRNVQGLGWAPDGRMFASEFGQSTLDELNEILPGANYGWPEVEGTGGADAAARGFTDPLATWATSDASPSGLAVTAEGVYLAGLRGARLWRVPLTQDGVGEPQALLAGELGRLRAVEPAPDGGLWVVTNNTDGRGDPRPGDDRIVHVTVERADQAADVSGGTGAR